MQKVWENFHILPKFPYKATASNHAHEKKKQ